MVGHRSTVWEASMLLLVLLLMLPYNNLITANTTATTSLHCVACLLKAWPVKGVLP